jgi:hypothetical protein
MSLAVLAAAMLSPAPAGETPRAFVERLYASYRDSNYSPFTRAARVFAPPFVAALREDSRLFRDEVGFIDADPICQCQDAGGLRARVAGVRQPTAAAAEARILLRFGDTDSRDLILRLVRTRAGWRVADIATADDPSFLGELQASNRKKRSGR